jgi:hypothetical protein
VHEGSIPSCPTRVTERSLTEQQLLRHHHDDTMDGEEIAWVWVPRESHGYKYGYWRRENEEEEALRILEEAKMLPEYKLEELPI